MLVAVVVQALLVVGGILYLLSTQGPPPSPSDRSVTAAIRRFLDRDHRDSTNILNIINQQGSSRSNKALAPALEATTKGYNSPAEEAFDTTVETPGKRSVIPGKAPARPQSAVKE